MDKLNKRQRLFVWIAIGLAIAMFIYPPASEYRSNRMSGSGRAQSAGYALIWSVEIIDYTRLLIQYGILCVVTWASVTSSGRRE